MNANTFGHLFQVSTFGESHGRALGALVQGCPAGIPFDQALLERNLQRRRPGQSAVTTARSEEDRPEIFSGVFEGRTLGTPIAMAVFNKDADSTSYTKENLKTRPGHATDLWQEKFGHSDPRGSGRASGRETLSRVLGGSVAEMFLNTVCPELKVFGFVSQVGPWQWEPERILEIAAALNEGRLNAYDFQTRIPDAEQDQEISRRLIKAKEEGDSFGGTIEMFITNVPPYLGQPVFRKMKSELTAAMMSVGATQSVEFGFAHQERTKPGSSFHQNSEVYAGLRGGITTGERLHLRVGFKPPATLATMARQGRHDPCILPRALPVLEAMVHLVLADQVLWRRLDR